jgi:hypothetical protein
MFEVAESVTSGRSGQVISPVLIDELPSDFHTFRLPAKEILASSSMPALPARRQFPSISHWKPGPGPTDPIQPVGLDDWVET